MGDFEQNSLWSPRVASEWLRDNVPVQRDWLSWLANDRRKSSPIVPFEKFAGYSVLYKRTDIERLPELIWKSVNGGAQDAHD